MRGFVLLVAVLALSLDLSATEIAECSERELPAGTVLDDGTVAGEAQALAYFKRQDPELYSRLTVMPKDEMRRNYGKYFEWFQRVGNCRKVQKRAMIEQLKASISLKDLVAEFQKTSDSRQKSDLRTRIRGLLESSSRSEIELLRHNLRSMRESLKELQSDVAHAESELNLKEKHQTAGIDKTMRDLGIK